MKSTVFLIVLAALVFSVMSGGCTKSADSFIDSAKAHLTKGRDREAAIELKNALATQPDHAEANFLLGRLLLKVGNPIDAQNALNKALKLGYSPAAVTPVLAESLLEMERYIEALETLKLSADFDRKAMAKVAVLRGKAYLGQGALLDARTQFQLAISDLPTEAGLGLVRLSVATNDRKGAQNQLDALIESDPKNADAWVARGELLRGEGRTDDALKSFRKALEVAPDHVVAMLSEAVVLVTTGDLEGGRALIERATKIAPLKPMLEFARAFLALKEKRYEDTRAALQRLLEVIPTHAPALLLAGALDFSTEQYELAQNAYVAYLANNPGNPYARKMLAATMLAKGQPRLAVNVLEPVLDGSQDPELIAIAGRAYLTMGRIPRAIELLQRALGITPNNADLRTSLGLSQLAAGQRSQAMANFEAAISLKPKMARADHALTMMLIADRQLARAEKVAMDLVDRLPDVPDGPMLMGAVQLARKDDAAARASFERALSMNPTFFAAAEALADIDRREGKPDALRQRMEAILARDTQHFESLLVLARLDLEEGSSEKGVARVRQALTAHPRSLPALLMLARLQLASGKPQEAITSARRAMEEHPWDTRPVELLADAQLASGDVQAGIVTLTKLAEMRPSLVDPQLRIAAAHVATGDLRSAVSRLQGVLRADPRNIRAQAALGDVFIQMKRTDEALTLAQQMQKTAPQAAAGYRLEGDVLAATGGWAKAVAAYQKADARQSSGELRVRMHRAQTAVAGQLAPTNGLQDWLKRNPGDDDVRLYLGDAYSDAGRYKDATVEYLELLRRRPDDFRVLNNLAWAMLQTGDAGALVHAEKAAKLRPDDPRVLDTLGYVLLANGRVQEAVQILLKASAKAPEHAEIRFHLAQALARVGDVVRAKKELAAVLAPGVQFNRTAEARALLAALGK